jgi:hypothetical protein
VLSVLVYPLIAVTLHRSALTPADAGVTDDVNDHQPVRPPEPEA